MLPEFRSGSVMWESAQRCWVMDQYSNGTGARVLGVREVVLRTVLMWLSGALG